MEQYGLQYGCFRPYGNLVVHMVVIRIEVHMVLVVRIVIRIEVHMVLALRIVIRMVIEVHMFVQMVTNGSEWLANKSTVICIVIHMDPL